MCGSFKQMTPLYNKIAAQSCVSLTFFLMCPFIQHFKAELVGPFCKNLMYFDSSCNNLQELRFHVCYTASK